MTSDSGALERDSEVLAVAKADVMSRRGRGRPRGQS